MDLSRLLLWLDVSRATLLPAFHLGPSRATLHASHKKIHSLVSANLQPYSTVNNIKGSYFHWTRSISCPCLPQRSQTATLGVNKGDMLEVTRKEPMMKRLRRKVSAALPTLAISLRIRCKSSRNSKGETMGDQVYAPTSTPASVPVPAHAGAGPASLVPVFAATHVPVPISVPIPATSHAAEPTTIPTNSSPEQRKIPHFSHIVDRESISSPESNPKQLHSNERRQLASTRMKNGPVSLWKSPSFCHEPRKEQDQAVLDPGLSRSRTTVQRTKPPVRNRYPTEDESETSPLIPFGSSQCCSPGNVAMSPSSEETSPSTIRHVSIDVDCDKLMEALRRKHLPEGAPSNGRSSTAERRKSRCLTSAASSLGATSLYSCGSCSERYRHRASLWMHWKIRDLEGKIRRKEQSTECTESGNESDNATSS
ncbi:hypothetical protein FRC15_011496 [Serendipita sp. 397]|nr:hypothetical protein FRC15_011496 [Serendipita sp. 397]